MLSKLGYVRREEIGNIIVESDMSYFELRQASVRRFTNAMGNPMYAYENAAVIQIGDLPNDVSSSQKKIKKVQKFKSTRSAKFSKSKSVRDGSSPSNNFEEFGLLSDTEYRPPGSQKKEKAKKSKGKQKKKNNKSMETPIGKPNSKKNKARRAAKLKGSSG